MRAKKITIMLWVTVISLLTLLVIVLSDDTVLANEVVPDTLDYYEEMVTVQADGSALVKITAVTGDGSGQALRFPFAFEDGEDFQVVSGSVEIDGPTVMHRGHRLLGVRFLPGAMAADTIAVTAVVPGVFDRESAALEFGEFALNRSFVNTSDLVMRNFHLSVDLPEGMLVHAVRKVHPAYNPKQSPKPPFHISRLGSRGRAELYIDLLPPAANVEMDLSIRPVRRGLLPLVLGLIAAVLYLVFFRDVLKKKKTE